jgi:hypothetical protein
LAGAYVALAQKRGDGAGRALDAPRPGFDNHARESRMKRQAEHASAVRRHFALVVERAQTFQ